MLKNLLKSKKQKEQEALDECITVTLTEAEYYLNHANSLRIEAENYRRENYVNSYYSGMVWKTDECESTYRKMQQAKEAAFNEYSRLMNEVDKLMDEKRKTA